VLNDPPLYYYVYYSVLSNHRPLTTTIMKNPSNQTRRRSFSSQVRPRMTLHLAVFQVLACLSSSVVAFVHSSSPSASSVSAAALLRHSTVAQHHQQQQLWAVHVDSRHKIEHSTTSATTADITSEDHPIQVPISHPSRLEETLERSRLPTRNSLNTLNDWNRSERIDMRCNDSADSSINEEDLESSTSSQSSSADASEEEQEEEETEKGNEESMEERRKMAARAALLGSRVGKSPNQRISKSTTSRTASKAATSTSVGARRTGSASKARQQAGVTERIMDAVRKSARSKEPTNEKDENDENNSSASTNMLVSSSAATSTATMKEAAVRGISASYNALPAKHKLSATRIHNAMMELMERQIKDRALPSPGTFGWESSLPVTMSRIPPPGTVLISSTASVSPIPTTYTTVGSSRSSMSSSSHLCQTANLQLPECLTVRTATPRCDTEVAELRLSVFSEFTPEVRKQLVSRSVKAVVTRRMQGATCLIATVPPSPMVRKKNRSPVILGSAECSFHEFLGTTLARRRPEQSILYITEVAVSPNARRKGVGSKLLEVCFHCVLKYCWKF